MSYPFKSILTLNEDVVELLLMLQECLAEDPKIEYLRSVAPSRY